MKLALTLTLAAILTIAAASRAESITVITNYFPGYVSVTNGWTTWEETGLSNGTAYVAIPLASLPALTASNAVADGAGSDVRVLLYAVNDQAYTVFAATTSTNRPSNTTVSRSITVDGADYNASHALQTKWTYTATLTPQ